MIIVNKEITKNELLKEMAIQLHLPDPTLSLEIESLPNFLNTPVAFTIFNYQISNFPKTVFWLSYNPQILEFLHNCQANFPPNFLASQLPLLTTQEPQFSQEYLSLISQEFENVEEPVEEEPPKIKIVESINEDVNFERVSDFTTQDNRFINFSNLKKKPEEAPKGFQNEFPGEKNFDDSEQKSQRVVKNRKKIDFNFPISEQLKNISDYESLSVRNLFRQKTYNSSSLIRDGKEINSEIPENYDTRRSNSKTQIPQKKSQNRFFKIFFPNKNKPKRSKVEFDFTDFDNFNPKPSKFSQKENAKINTDKTETENYFHSKKNPAQKPFQNQPQNQFESQSYQDQFQESTKETRAEAKNFAPNQNEFPSQGFNSASNFTENDSRINQKTSQNQGFNPNSFNPFSGLNSNFGNSQKKASNFENSNPANNSHNPEKQNKKFIKTKPFPENFSSTKENSRVRFQNDVFSDFSKKKLKNFWNSFLLKKNVLVLGISSSSIAIFIFLFFVSFFPTQAYTLEISPVGGVGETELELNLQQFESKNLLFENQNSVIPTGKEEIKLPKAIGKVQLINRGNRPVFLTNGGFLLTSKDRVYYQLPLGNSSTLSIPAGNQNNPIEVQIEAEEAGNNYNLDKDEILTITNLKGEGVCDNCFGKVLESVKNTKPNPSAIISEEDKKNLIAKANAEIVTKIEKEAQEMNKNNTLSDQSWFKTLDKNEIFVGEVGKPASELKLTTKMNINLFGLKNSQIFRLLKEKNDKIFQASGFQIISSSGWDSENKSIKVKISYNYSQYDNLSTDEILTELAQSPVSEVQKKFQARYAGLKKIQKEETGIKVPGITPRVNIDIIKNENIDVNNK